MQSERKFAMCSGWCEPRRGQQKVQMSSINVYRPLKTRGGYQQPFYFDVTRNLCDRCISIEAKRRSRRRWPELVRRAINWLNLGLVVALVVWYWTYSEDRANWPGYYLIFVVAAALLVQALVHDWWRKPLSFDGGEIDAQKIIDLRREGIPVTSPKLVPFR